MNEKLPASKPILAVWIWCLWPVVLFPFFIWWFTVNHHDFIEKPSLRLAFWNFWLTAIGAILGVLAYWVAVWQITDARKSANQAAEAAKSAADAAKDAYNRLSDFSGYVGLTEMCAISSHVCLYLQHKKFDIAQDRLGTLLRLFARVQAGTSVASLQPREDWTRLKEDMFAVQKVLVDRAAVPRNFSPTAIAECSNKMISIDERINMLKNKHEHELGESHAIAG